MKVVKLFGGFLALALVLIIAVMIYVFTNINQLIKEAVETVGPKVTQTHVGLRDVDVKLLDGKGELKHFVVGNPAGFDSDYLLKWDTVRLQVDPASVQENVVVIKEVTVEGVNIIAEQKGMGTNIQALLDTLNSGQKSSAGKPSAEGSGESDVRLMVENLRFADNSIDFVTEKFGQYTLELPSFELANIGDKQQGLTPEQLGYAILKPLMEQSKKAVQKRLEGLAKEELEAKLNEKKEELKAKAREKEEELKAQAKAKEDELKAKAEEEKARLEEKLGTEATDKLKSLFDKK